MGVIVAGRFEDGSRLSEEGLYAWVREEVDESFTALAMAGGVGQGRSNEPPRAVPGRTSAC
jgi:hypothetical protein